MDKLTIQSQMISHMSLSTSHHSLTKYTVKNKDVVVCEFIGESKIRKRKGTYGEFGKSESLWYFSDTPRGKEFKTIEELLKSVNITKEQLQ